MTSVPRLLSAWIFAVLALLLGLQARAQTASPAGFKPVPAYATRVTDEIGMLTPEQRQRLENVLGDYETKTGSQIAVLLVASTEPEAIEQYSIRVTDAWKLGRKGVDDGVLLLVARDNPKALRRLRIESGRGVQGVLTDAQSKRILQDTIAPHFKQNDYYGGLVAGVGAIATLLNQEKFPAPKPKAAPSGSVDGFGVGVSFALIIGGILLIRSMFRPRRGLTQAGIPSSNGHLANGQSSSGWSDVATGVILGNLLSGSSRDDSERWRGGNSSSSGGFSDSGGGGFSGGGGGSFDGGGASGDW